MTMLDDLSLNNEINWNLIAKSFDKTRQKPWRICIEFIETLSKDDVILDIGCGNGRHLIPCAYKVNKIIGLDISIELLKIVYKKKINNKLKNISLLHSNFQYLPIKNNSVDAVLFIASLHNIYKRKNRIRSLIELRRILKKNGKALISVWSKWQDKYRSYFINKLFFNIKKKNEFGDINIYWKKDNLNIPRFYHLYSKREFINDIKKSELKLSKIYDIKLKSTKYIDNYFAIVEKK
jgi:alkylated DNA repair protein alkB family protein 8